jgi:tetratricopeptide (TPR) repeat protein
LSEETGQHDTRRDVLFHLIQANASAGNYRFAVSFGRRLLEAPDEGPAGITTSSLTRMWLAWCLAELGKFEEAHQHVEAAFAISRITEQPLPVRLAHLGRGLVHLRQERFADAAAWLEPVLSFAEKPNLEAWWGAIASPLGRAWVGLGRVADAVALLESVVAHSVSSRGSGHVLRTIHLGEAYLAAGRVPNASTIASHALKLAQAHGERGHEAYALLLLGQVAMAQGLFEDAHASLTAAEALSAELGMSPLNGRVRRLLAQRPEDIKRVAI